MDLHESTQLDKDQPSLTYIEDDQANLPVDLIKADSDESYNQDEWDNYEYVDEYSSAH